MLRASLLKALAFALAIPATVVAIEAETPGRTTLPAPKGSWFTITGLDGTYLFDGDTGEMQGLISHGWYTPAVEPNIPQDEFYLVESFYSRGVHGERTDVLTIVDLPTLSTKAEIEIPAKTAALPYRHHIGFMNNRCHVAVFNMTPAQSISIVDVIDRTFVGEISTPGCAIIMPAGDQQFLMICGDGTLQLIRLDGAGKESGRTRSKSFFVVEEDPVFPLPLQTNDGWLLVSHGGQAYDVEVDGDDIRVSKPWSIGGADDTDKEWRPGGSQALAFHRELQLLYVLMHEGGVDTHGEPGTEVWVIDSERKRRIARVTLETSASHMVVSDEARPKLFFFDTTGKVQIFDGLALKFLRQIDEPGVQPGLVQLGGL
jgi:methylamine dehydrogenase heavy chain